MIKAGLAEGRSVEEQRKDPVAWQMNLLKKDFELFDDLAKSGDVVIADTSFIETVVFAARAGIEMSPEVEVILVENSSTKFTIQSNLAIVDFLVTRKLSTTEGESTILKDIKGRGKKLVAKKLSTTEGESTILKYTIARKYCIHKGH